MQRIVDHQLEKYNVSIPGPSASSQSPFAAHTGQGSTILESMSPPSLTEVRLPSHVNQQWFVALRGPQRPIDTARTVAEPLVIDLTLLDPGVDPRLTLDACLLYTSPSPRDS